jgi:hypothetical protein
MRLQACTQDARPFRPGNSIVVSLVWGICEAPIGHTRRRSIGASWRRKRACSGRVTAICWATVELVSSMNWRNSQLVVNLYADDYTSSTRAFASVCTLCEQSTGSPLPFNLKERRGDSRWRAPFWKRRSRSTFANSYNNVISFSTEET